MKNNKIHVQTLDLQEKNESKISRFSRDSFDITETKIDKQTDNNNQLSTSSIIYSQSNMHIDKSNNQDNNNFQDDDQNFKNDEEYEQYQANLIRRRDIFKRQDDIIEDLYNHQKQIAIKDIRERSSFDPLKVGQYHSYSNNNQNASNRYSYSVNDGQTITSQRQSKEDILRMLNPQNYLMNKIQKEIENRQFSTEIGQLQNTNDIETGIGFENKKNIFKEKENLYKFLLLDKDNDKDYDDKGELSSENLVTKKIIKILSELKEIQNKDEKSIFSIALKEYCEKFHKQYEYVYDEETTNKNQEFLCEVVLNGLKMGQQIAKSKKDAKTLACMSAIAREMQSASNLEPMYYFQRFLETTRSKYAKLSENIAEAYVHQQQNYDVKGNTNNDPLNDLAVAQNIPEDYNFREELSIFAHKKLHKQINWETIFDPKEKLWLAIVDVGNLTERGFGRNKKYAKNVASYKLLQRCKDLNMKDDIIKNPKKLKSRLQFAQNLQEQENDQKLINLQNGQQNLKFTYQDQLNKKRNISQAISNNDIQTNQHNNKLGNKQELEPDLIKKQKLQSQQTNQQVKINEVLFQLEEKYIDCQKLKPTISINSGKLSQSYFNMDTFQLLQKYDSEIAASKAQYQSLQNMYNEFSKELFKKESNTFLKKLIPIGSYVNNCMNKNSTTMDVVAIYTPTQSQEEVFEANRFCDILYSEVQIAILNCNISDYFKMELNKGCVILIFTHNQSYKIRLIPNLILNESLYEKSKLQKEENILNSQVKPILDPNEHKYYSDSLMHQVWLSKFKDHLHKFESLFRIFRRIFKVQGFKIPIDLIDVILAHVSHQFTSCSFQDNVIGFVKFFAENGLEDIYGKNLQMVQICQFHYNMLLKCNEFELKKIQGYFNDMYLNKAYENLIIV